jgi:predicted NAD/FAD-binding protein
MVADLVRFNREARALLRRAGGDGPSLGSWLEELRFSRPFVERLIVPQGGPGATGCGWGRRCGRSPATPTA